MVMGIRYIPVWLMQFPNLRIFNADRVGVLIGLRARGAIRNNYYQICDLVICRTGDRLLLIV